MWQLSNEPAGAIQWLACVQLQLLYKLLCMLLLYVVHFAYSAYAMYCIDGNSIAFFFMPALCEGQYQGHSDGQIWQ